MTVKERVSKKCEIAIDKINDDNRVTSHCCQYLAGFQRAKGYVDPCGEVVSLLYENSDARTYLSI